MLKRVTGQCSSSQIAAYSIVTTKCAVTEWFKEVPTLLEENPDWKAPDVIAKK